MKMFCHSYVAENLFKMANLLLIPNQRQKFSKVRVIIFWKYHSISMARWRAFYFPVTLGKDFWLKVRLDKENSRLFYATNSICVTVTSKSDKIFLFVTLINNNSIPFQIKF